MSKKNVFNIALLISIISIISKVFGFVRESLIGYRYGSGIETDTFFLTLSAVTLISSFITGAVSTTFIPTLTEIDNKEGKKGKVSHTNNMLSMILLVSTVLMLLGFIFAPFIIKIMAKGFEGEQLNKTIKLMRVGLPSILILGISGILIAFLRSEHSHIGPSSIGFATNFVYIIYLLFFYDKYGIKGLMITHIVSGFAQILILIPSLKKTGFKLKFEFDPRDKYIKKVLLLSLPVILSVAINDINNIIDKTLASELIEGSVSALNYAVKLRGLVWGIFITAITTVVYPILSEEASKDNIKGVKSVMASGTHLILLITVPAAVGMMVLASPIVQIAFERGAFDTLATKMTAGALIGYSIGMVSGGVRMLVNQVFYSIQDTRTPMINSGIFVILNLIFNLILVRPLNHVGLALGTSLASIFSLIILMYQLRKKIGPLGMRSYLEYLIKTGLASLVMGGAAYFTYNGLYGIFLNKYTGGRLKLFNLLSLMIAVGLGVLIYGIITYAMGIREIREMVDKIKSIIKR